MNIPGRSDIIRAAFVPPKLVTCPGCGLQEELVRTFDVCPSCANQTEVDSDYVFVFIDYSQIELRLTAHFSSMVLMLMLQRRTFHWIIEVSLFQCGSILFFIPMNKWSSANMSQVPQILVCTLGSIRMVAFVWDFIRMT